MVQGRQQEEDAQPGPEVPDRLHKACERSLNLQKEEDGAEGK